MRRIALPIVALAFAGTVPAQAAAPRSGVGRSSAASTGQFSRTLGQSPRVLMATPQAVPLARVQVVAVEFHYRLSRVRIPAGPVRIELTNFGQDEHDLTLQRVGGTTVYQLPKALPGERRVQHLRLKPGLYRLSCSMADHASRGMQANLRVVSRRR